MKMSTEQRKRDFSAWLRTGRRAKHGNRGEIEFKFNPWHDPVDGRFTFAGTGRYFGRGGAKSAYGQGQSAPTIEYVDDPGRQPLASMEAADAWRVEQLAEHGDEPGYPEAIEARYRHYSNAFVRRSDGQSSLSIDQGAQLLAQRQSFEGGGSFGGSGASGSWENVPAPNARQTMEAGSLSEFGPTPEIRTSELRQSLERRGPQSDSDGWRQVSRNGYLYEIDDQDRTRRVSGALTVNNAQGRSRTMQRAAGGNDRRASDHGGHYIARRFNGPTETFNHFAQDANFNRGDYRRLEEEWARARRSGKHVRVKIVPVYEGASQLPSALNIWFWLDSKGKSLKLPNESKGIKNAQ